MPRQRRDARYILELTEQLARLESLSQRLHALVEIATLELGAERGTIFLNDEATGELYSEVTNNNWQQVIRIGNRTGIAGTVFSSGQSIVENSPAKNPLFNRTVDKNTGFHTKNLICSPIRTQTGEILGVTQILNKIKSSFNKLDLRFLDTITAQVAIYIQSALERSRLDRLTKQTEITERISRQHDLDARLGELLRGTLEVLNATAGTLFFHIGDRLVSRVARAETLDGKLKIEISDHQGIAGQVFQTGQPAIVNDPENHPSFSREIDFQTGFTTKQVLSAPIESFNKEVVGVAEILNKKDGDFTPEDLLFLTNMTRQAAVLLQNAFIAERDDETRKEEERILGLVSQISSEIHLRRWIDKVLEATCSILDAERATLFLKDEKHPELYAAATYPRGGEEAEQMESVPPIRFGHTEGIAGTVFKTGKSEIILHPYADLRFNPEIDQKLGFFTESILCVPLRNKKGKVVGVTQVLNKMHGTFAEADSKKLIAFTAQIAMGLENAKLFERIQDTNDYIENVLASSPIGVLTLGEDRRVEMCNREALKILVAEPKDTLKGTPVSGLFASPENRWLLDRLVWVEETNEPVVMRDCDVKFHNQSRSLNTTILPLLSRDKKKRSGFLFLLEDISDEKRIKSTLARYMDPAVVEEVLRERGSLPAKVIPATILFSDIRGFTKLSENVPPQRTVSFLNEYFATMVEPVQKSGGIIDKFIGDAIMAVFGTVTSAMPSSAPETHEEQAVQAGIDMLRELEMFNKRLRERGEPEVIRIGIGLNAGEVVSGNIGSAKRMDFTVVGDTVNVASRIEKLCKTYGASLLVGESVFKKAKNICRKRVVDKVKIRGRDTPLVIYEVLDYRCDESSGDLDLGLSLFELARGLYLERQWQEAEIQFGRALEKMPEDALCREYQRRCRAFASNPPHLDWDFVWDPDLARPASGDP